MAQQQQQHKSGPVFLSQNVYSRRPAVTGTRVFGQDEQQVLVSEGIPPAAAGTIMTTDTGQWVLAGIAAALGLAALIWLLILTIQVGHHRRDDDGCRPPVIAISNVTELDVLSPSPLDVAGDGSVQGVTGSLYNSNGASIGNVTGFCITSNFTPGPSCAGMGSYIQTCTLVYDFFCSGTSGAVGSLVTTGLIEIVNATSVCKRTTEPAITPTVSPPVMTWVITGGDGCYNGAYGTATINATADPTAVGVYMDTFNFNVPCRPHHHNGASAPYAGKDGLGPWYAIGMAAALLYQSVH
jgi:hypothetical protein